MRSISLSQKEIGTLIREVARRTLNRIPVTNQYEFIRVKDGDIFFILHNTGKMVFQESKGFDSFLDDILIREDHFIIGTDEVGKGEWYGPLVVAGIALTPDQTIMLRKMGVGDSKGLSSFRIYEIGKVLEKSDIEKATRVLLPEEYNKIYEEFEKEKKNLNDILAWAHTEIIQDLLTKAPSEKTTVVIDKFDSSASSVRFKKLEEFDVDIIQKTGGESETAVAAASVLAKLIFEEHLKKLNQKFGLDLRNADPEDISEDVLPAVAKLHFRNVKKVLKD